MFPSEDPFWGHDEDDPFYFGIPARLDEDGREIPDHDGSGGSRTPTEIEEDFTTKEFLAAALAAHRAIDAWLHQPCGSKVCGQGCRKKIRAGYVFTASPD
jgi:hypothetical protein